MWPTDSDTVLDEHDAKVLPGQQLEASHAQSTLDHILKLDVQAPAACLRLTGIMASMGKSTYDLEILENMISSGMNIAMLNMAFGSKSEHSQCIKTLKQAAKNHSVRMGRLCPLAIAMKLAGKKIRTGRVSDIFGGAVEIKTGEIVRLTTDDAYRDRCSSSTIYVDLPNFSEQVKKGDFVFLDNESIILKVEILSVLCITCKVQSGGTLVSYRDVYVPNKNINMPNYSDKDRADIAVGLHHQIDIVIIPFVADSHQIEELKEIMGERGKKVAIMSCIQNMAGYLNFDEILAASDAIMVVRQELGCDVSPDKLIIAQKNLLARANKVNVPAFVCAHLLASMKTEKAPLRAEVLDIANCILDGADALMLSSETAIGKYPVETVQFMAQACKEAEACMWTKQILYNLIDTTALPCDQPTGAALAAALTAQRAIAAAIIAITTSGKSAHLTAKFRPRCPIIAVTRYPLLARQMHMWRGILPLVYEDTPDSDWQVDIDNRVVFALQWALERGFMRIGDPVVVLSGWRKGGGATNTMRIIYVSENIGN